MIAISLLIAVAVVGQVESGGRVFNGDKADRNEYPWLVRIDTGRSSSCGGTLVDKRWVLTSATCLMNSKRLVIYVGDYNRKQRDGEQIIRARKIVYHPYYFARTMEDDLAMIRLDRPVKLGRSVKVIDQLTTFSTSKSIMNGKADRCVLVGWGEDKLKTDKWRRSTFPQDAEAKILGIGRCADEDKTVKVGSSGCAKLKGVKAACKSDVGGPIACLLDGKWVLESVYSYSLYGKGKQEPCSRENMVTSWIVFHKEWINNVIAKEDTGMLGYEQASKYRAMLHFWDYNKDSILEKEVGLQLFDDYFTRANNTAKKDIMRHCWVAMFGEESKISPEDFMQFRVNLRKSGVPDEEITKNDKICIDSGFTSFDDNADGFISKEEYRNLAAFFNHTNTKYVDRVFAFYNPVNGRNSYTMMVPIIHPVDTWSSFLARKHTSENDKKLMKALYEMIFPPK